jgi:hypothetical protein
MLLSFRTLKKAFLMNRKKFLHRAVIGTGGILATPFLSFSQTTKSQSDPLPAEKVKAFVVAGHGNFDEVKKLLAELPTLLYATWDWGNGDFETALEGAGHMGQKEIANYLINQGARANLFVLTMLGKTTIVKSYLETFPEYLNARGPHGFTFLHHAQKGAGDAKELLDFFQSKGLKETRMPL